MKIDSTAAKIGRSMKNLENIGRAPLLLLVRLGLLRLRLLLLRGRARLRLRARAGLRDAHRRAGPQAHQALDDHAVAGADALVHDPRVARPFADLDRPRLRGV